MEATKRAGRMTWMVLMCVGAMAVATSAAAQAEAGDGVARLVERPYTAALELYMVGPEFAGAVPFSGETSDFGGFYSEPVDMVWRSRLEGIDSVFGRFTGVGITCIKAEWGVDQDGAPAMTGMRISEMKGPFVLPDGSTIDTELTFQGRASMRRPGRSRPAFSGSPRVEEWGGSRARRSTAPPVAGG